MSPDNPAVYECPKSASGIHFWKRNADGTATCDNCHTTTGIIASTMGGYTYRGRAR